MNTSESGRKGRQTRIENARKMTREVLASQTLTSTCYCGLVVHGTALECIEKMKAHRVGAHNEVHTAA